MRQINITVPFEIHATLERLARKQASSIAEVLTDAVALYEESLFWKTTRASYERLNNDPAARAAIDAELAPWDTTINDALADFPFEENAE